MNLTQKLALAGFGGGAGLTSQLLRAFTSAENEVTELLRELLKCNSLPPEINFFKLFFIYFNASESCFPPFGVCKLILRPAVPQCYTADIAGFFCVCVVFFFVPRSSNIVLEMFNWITHQQQCCFHIALFGGGEGLVLFSILTSAAENQ